MRYTALFLFFFFSLLLPAKDNSYHYFIDLNNIKNDKLRVNLIPPAINASEVLFRMPAMVPGTYAVYNFGRFVSNIIIYWGSGDSSIAEQVDVNTWKIPNLPDVQKISYWVEDTWDSEKRDAFVFEPAGTNIQNDSCFVINTHGFFGYFENYKHNPFHLEFAKPKRFYGSTALVADKNTASFEQYTVSDYMRLVDSPIMFCVPDTVTLNIGGAKILVSVYSSKNRNYATTIGSNIQTLLSAQKDYLGGTLPISKYAFIIYLFSDGQSDLSGAYGALEHSYSSFYYVPEMDTKQLAQNIRDFASHEFFHIITPLSIHSEEIGDFDYNNPKMSQHLWLYEGVTEYFAGHMQVKQGLISLNDYLGVIHAKIEGREEFNDTLPFTEMSLGCLHQYKDQYDNVYQKGPLIGLCIDIKLRSLSNGKYGIQDLINDLAKTYGKNRSFKDSELFDEIIKLSYPEIGDFLRTYISGNKPLPLAELLNLVGITYNEIAIEHGLSPLGGIMFLYDNASGHFYIGEDSYKGINAFGKTIGFNIGDEILKFNRKRLNIFSFEKILENYFEKAKEGDNLRLTVLRKDDAGKKHKVKLKTKLSETDYEIKNVLKLNKNADTQQLMLRKNWLNTN